MTTEFILPDIGEGIVECELLEWLVDEGDAIVEDQPVAEVMTDKATVQIPAMYTGTVKTLHYKPGDIAKVHAPLFSMSVADASDASSMDEPLATTSQQLPAEKNSKQRGEDFLLPDIGEGMVECEIVNWQVAEGDVVAEDQVIVEVMTDKAVVEIPAKYAGTISRLYYQQGDIASVHAPLFALVHEGVATSEFSGRSPADAATPEQEARSSVSTMQPRWDDSREGDFEPPVVIPGKVLASPAVRRVAREKDIDLQAVKGSGKKGRILKKDLIQPAQSADSDTRVARSSSQSANIECAKAEKAQAGGTRTEKVRGVQAIMARQMQLSVQTIPHFSVSDELVMDKLIALRSELKPAFEEKGVKLSFLPFFIKALSLALSEFPVINSQLNDDATELTYFDDHNIGFAVDSKIGLLVPNIKRVQDRSLFDIAEQMQKLIEQAREGKLPSVALKGGTISVSNIGALGGITATPVINKPEAAIVALGKIQKLPRFRRDGSVSAQHIMHMNWSGDHRIIDGATMVKFNNLCCRYLSEPSSMLMHLR